MPQYPTGERPTNLHELVSSSLSAEERLQTLCEHVVNAETEKLEAAFQGEYSFIAEAGAHGETSRQCLWNGDERLCVHFISIRQRCLFAGGPWPCICHFERRASQLTLRLLPPGVEALKEFQLQVEQASIQGEIRCGSAPVPGLAEKKERLRAMLRQCAPAPPLRPTTGSGHPRLLTFDSGK